MKIYQKMALITAIVLYCSPVVSNAESIASANSSADTSINVAKLPTENVGDKRVRLHDRDHSLKNSKSKKGLFGILSLIFVSIL